MREEITRELRGRPKVSSPEVERARRAIGEGLAQTLDSLEERENEIIAGLIAQTDQEYLRWLTAYLQRVSGCDYALVGELAGADWSHVTTLALHTKEGPADGLPYDLLGALLSDVVAGPACACPTGAAQAYPEDHLVQELGADSYVGTSLNDPARGPLGFMLLLHTTPLSEEQVRRASSMLQVFRRRTESVLMNNRSLHDLELLQQLEPAGAGDMLGKLTGALAHAMHVKVAFVSQYVDEGKRDLRSLALTIDGVAQDGVQYSIVGTPCESVYEAGIAFFPSGLRERFPDDEFLQTLGAEAYMAVGFFDRNGEAMGHLGIIHDRPIPEAMREHPLICTIAGRVGSELQRMRAEDERMAERREAEEHRSRMVNELDHRVKNTLATVLALCEQTMAASDTLDGFKAAYTSRLRAMARTHQALSFENWRGVPLDEMLSIALAPYVQGDRERVTTEGEHIVLSAQMTTALGMALNELATNAVKHGALSIAGGKIDARWLIAEDGRLQFEWTERGGPPVEPPNKSGFGLQLVRGLIEHELGGEVTFDFEPAGLLLRLRVPMVERRSRAESNLSSSPTGE